MLGRMLDSLDKFSLAFVACATILIGIGLLVVYGLEEGRAATTLILGGLGLAVVWYYVHRRAERDEETTHERSSEDRE